MVPPPLDSLHSARMVQAKAMDQTSWRRSASIWLSLALGVTAFGNTEAETRIAQTVKQAIRNDATPSPFVKEAIQS